VPIGIEDFGDFLVAHPLQADQKNDRALFVRQLGDGAFEIAQFEALALVRRLGKHRLGFAQARPRALAHRAAEPGSHIDCGGS